MRKWLLAPLVLSASTVAVADPAQPAQPASMAAVAPSKATTPKEKLVCKTEEVVGSRLAARRTCLTASQWADQKLQDQQLVSRVQTPGPTNGH